MSVCLLATAQLGSPRRGRTRRVAAAAILAAHSRMGQSGTGSSSSSPGTVRGSASGFGPGAVWLPLGLHAWRRPCCRCLQGPRPPPGLPSPSPRPGAGGCRARPLHCAVTVPVARSGRQVCSTAVAVVARPRLRAAGGEWGCGDPCPAARCHGGGPGAPPPPASVPSRLAHGGSGSAGGPAERRRRHRRRAARSPAAAELAAASPRPDLCRRLAPRSPSGLSSLPPPPGAGLTGGGGDLSPATSLARDVCRRRGGVADGTR